jgi:hypothetical protein
LQHDEEVATPMKAPIPLEGSSALPLPAWKRLRRPSPRRRVGSTLPPRVDAGRTGWRSRRVPGAVLALAALAAVVQVAPDWEVPRGLLIVNLLVLALIAGVSGSWSAQSRPAGLDGSSPVQWSLARAVLSLLSWIAATGLACVVCLVLHGSHEGGIFGSTRQLWLSIQGRYGITLHVYEWNNWGKLEGRELVECLGPLCWTADDDPDEVGSGVMYTLHSFSGQVFQLRWAGGRWVATVDGAEAAVLLHNSGWGG